MKLVHLVVLAQVLSNLSVAVLVVGHDDVTGVCGCDTRFAIKLSRQIALPVFLVLPDVLNSERKTIVHQQWLA